MIEYQALVQDFDPKMEHCKEKKHLIYGACDKDGFVEQIKTYICGDGDGGAAIA